VKFRASLQESLYSNKRGKGRMSTKKFLGSLKPIMLKVKIQYFFVSIIFTDDTYLSIFLPF